MSGQVWSASRMESRGSEEISLDGVCLQYLKPPMPLLTWPVVEIDLTNSSMVAGKKGFDRLIYASKNAFAAPITWLFCNISASKESPIDTTFLD